MQLRDQYHLRAGIRHQILTQV
eukprot:COSAG02_NODE_59705_length_273_cov_0.890805_1_plen_21_part_10